MWLLILLLIMWRFSLLVNRAWTAHVRARQVVETNTVESLALLADSLKRNYMKQ